MKAVALVVDQEKFTNCPGAVTAGATLKAVTVGLEELPPPPVVPPPDVLLVVPPPHPAAIKSKSILSRETVPRDRDIVRKDLPLAFGRPFPS